MQSLIGERTRSWRVGDAGKSCITTLTPKIVVAFSSKETWDSEDWVVPSSRTEMYADYDGWGTTIRNLLSLVEKPDIWAMFDHLPAASYCKGRVYIIGDAAHASTPHQGISFTFLCYTKIYT